MSRFPYFGRSGNLIPGNICSKSNFNFPNKSWLYNSTNYSLRTLLRVSTSEA